MCISNSGFFDSKYGIFLAEVDSTNERKICSLHAVTSHFWIYPHLAQLRLSDIRLALVDRAYMSRETFQCGGLLDFIVFYGGVGNLSRELLLQCLHGASSTQCTAQWIMTAWVKDWGCGLMHCVALAREHLFGWAQCSSFVALCASVSKWCLESQWMGDSGREFVQVGNCHMIVTALIYFLATLLHCATCLEQPLNSCLPDCPLMASVLTFCKAIKVNMHLCSFGAEMPKPLQIWTTCQELQDLWGPTPSNLPGTQCIRSWSSWSVSVLLQAPVSCICQANSMHIHLFLGEWICHQIRPLLALDCKFKCHQVKSSWSWKKWWNAIHDSNDEWRVWFLSIATLLNT